MESPAKEPEIKSWRVAVQELEKIVKYEKVLLDMKTKITHIVLFLIALYS